MIQAVQQDWLSQSSQTEESTLGFQAISLCFLAPPKLRS
jgi:hypothetical protein